MRVRWFSWIECFYILKQRNKLKVPLISTFHASCIFDDVEVGFLLNFRTHYFLKSTNSSRSRNKRKLILGIHRYCFVCTGIVTRIRIWRIYQIICRDLVLWIDSFLHGNKGNVVFASPRKHISKDTKTQTARPIYSLYQRYTKENPVNYGERQIKNRNEWILLKRKPRKLDDKKSKESYINTYIRVYFIDARIFSHIPT